MYKISEKDIQTALDRYRNQDFEDWSDILNTPLTKEQQAQFETWKKDLVRRSGNSGLANTNDYDLQGAFLDGLQPTANAHLSDKFKKPNHMTFSTDSQYNGLGGVMNGGTWTKLPDGRWAYNVDPSSRQPKSAMTGYMSQAEKGNDLIDNRPSSIDSEYGATHNYFDPNTRAGRYIGNIDKNTYAAATSALNPSIRDIVMDLDETVLDNSKNQAAIGKRRGEIAQALKAQGYTDDYIKKNAFPMALDESHRTMQADALVPGALDYINAARRNGSRIHFITGRNDSPENRKNLENNLKNLGVSYDTLEFSAIPYGGSMGKERLFRKYNPQVSIGDSASDRAGDSQQFYRLTNTLYGKNLQPQEYEDQVREALDASRAGYNTYRNNMYDYVAANRDKYGMEGTGVVTDGDWASLPVNTQREIYKDYNRTLDNR